MKLGLVLGLEMGLDWKLVFFIGMVGDLEGDWIRIGAEGVEWDGIGM